MSAFESHQSEHNVMYASFASATLIVLGAVITVLGFLLAGNLFMAVTGLLSIFAGGLLGILERRVAR
jgi:hypothetical protein